MAYVPVAMGMGQARNMSKLFGKNMSWWQSDSVYRHPFVLYSAHPYSKFIDTREREEIPEDVCVFCDSGGYQVFSLGIKLDRDKVFEWQLKNGNMNFVLDCPPIIDFTKKTVVYNQVANQMGITYENSKWYAEQVDRHRRNGTLGRAKFILICHSFSVDQVGRDVERFTDLIDSFDGISVAYHGKDYWGFFSSVMKWKEVLGDRKKDLHILGMSGVKALPVVSYIQTLWNGRVTFDSSSVFAGGKYRTYWMNTTIDEAVRLRSGGQHRKMPSFPCLCPYCTLVSDGVDLDAPGIGTLIALHNLFVITQRTKVWDWLVDEDKEKFKKMAKNVGGWEFIEFIDRCMQYGWERAIKSYWWTAGSRNLVAERRRSEDEVAVNLVCFGQYDDEVCKGKCNLATQCKKVSEL